MIKDRDMLVLNHIEKYGGISLKSTSKIYFQDSYNSASRRMLQLEDKYKLVNSYQNYFTGDKVFYQDKVLPPHDLLTMDLWWKLIDLGFDVKKFRTKKKFLGGDIIADAFVESKFGDYTTYIIAEMDLTHFTKKSKIVQYERLYHSPELEELCGGIKPLLLIARPTENDVRYSSKFIDIVYTDIYFNKLDKFLFE